MNQPIKNADDLSRQTKIKYGLVSGGATEHFFKVESNLRKTILSEKILIT